MHKFYLIIFLVVFSSLGCALFENLEDLPMFVEIDEVSLTTNPAQGTTRHNILDIWPNADGQSLGVFELPISFPVLDDNLETNMIYFAGIRRAGISDDHTIYPFYERITFDRDFVADSTVVEDLNFNYKEETVFRIVEDFEINHVFTRDVDEDPETSIEQSGTGGIEGNCGLIKLSTDNPKFEAATSSELLSLPTDGTAVYMELDYLTEVNLSIGLQATVNGTEFEQYFITLTPNTSWNKVYIDLAEILQDSDLDAYRLLLGAQVIDETEAEIRIDNIKLMHF